MATVLLDTSAHVHVSISVRHVTPNPSHCIEADPESVYYMRSQYIRFYSGLIVQYDLYYVISGWSDTLGTLRSAHKNDMVLGIDPHARHRTRRTLAS